MPVFVNNQPIETFNFSGGECHVCVEKIALAEVTKVLAYLYTSNDVMQLLLTVDAIRRQCPTTRVDLTVPYFPYARQDRVCNPGEAFSVAVMAELINGLKCDSVTVVDPHSPVVQEQLQRCRVVSMVDIIQDSAVADWVAQHQLTVVAPDAGAASKVQAVAQALGCDGLYCRKQRDVKTRRILRTEIPADVNGRSFLVLDDICDGGRTFIELAKALQQGGAKALYLYVTHGIFSQGVKVLQPYFQRVFCYHSFIEFGQLDREYVTIIEEKANVH